MVQLIVRFIGKLGHNWRDFKNYRTELLENKTQKDI